MSAPSTSGSGFITGIALNKQPENVIDAATLNSAQTQQTDKAVVLLGDETQTQAKPFEEAKPGEMVVRPVGEAGVTAGEGKADEKAEEQLKPKKVKKCCCGH